MSTCFITKFKRFNKNWKWNLSIIKKEYHIMINRISLNLNRCSWYSYKILVNLLKLYLQLSIWVVISRNHSIIDGHQIKNCNWNQNHKHAWTRVAFSTFVHRGLHPLKKLSCDKNPFKIVIWYRKSILLDFLWF